MTEKKEPILFVDSELRYLSGPEAERALEHPEEFGGLDLTEEVVYFVGRRR